MKWFPSLRVLVFLRRAVLALERSATAHESIAAIALRREARELSARTRKPIPTEFGELDTKAATAAWHQRQAEQMTDWEDAT